MIPDQSRRYIFSAMVWRAWKRQTTRILRGSSFTISHMAKAESVPTSNPQNPPAGVARFQIIPMIMVAENAAS